MLRVLERTSQLIMLLVILGIPAAVWFVWHIDDWGLTPERAARRDGYCKDASLVKVQRQPPNTTLVVCQGLPNALDGGYVYVSRMPWGTWWASPNGANFSYQAPEVVSTELVDYLHGGPTQSVHTSLILLGRSRSPDVTAVEAHLSDGRILKNEVTNGLFVFDAPIGAVGIKVDTLNVVGQDNQVVQHIQVKPGY
jgi:hypothetical protein